MFLNPFESLVVIDASTTWGIWLEEGKSWADVTNSWHGIRLSPGNVNNNYRRISNIKRTFECNEIVYHSDVVEAAPVGAAPTTSSFSA